MTRADRYPCKILFLYSAETKLERQYCVMIKSGTHPVVKSYSFLAKPLASVFSSMKWRSKVAYLKRF